MLHFRAGYYRLITASYRLLQSAPCNTRATLCSPDVHAVVVTREGFEGFVRTATARLFRGVTASVAPPPVADISCSAVGRDVALSVDVIEEALENWLSRSRQNYSRSLSAGGFRSGCPACGSRCIGIAPEYR